MWGVFRNCLVLTNFHIIDIDKRKFFRKKITKFMLDDIDEVHAVQKSRVQKFFNYGNIVFRLGSIKGDLVLKYVSDPDYLKDIIVNTIENSGSEETRMQAKKPKNLPSDEKIRHVLMKIKNTLGEDRFFEMIDELDNEK